MRLLTLIFLTLYTGSVYAQNVVDSLFTQLELAQDSVKYNILTQIADEYYYENEFSKSAAYYKKAADYAELQDPPDLRHLSESYGNYGYCLYEMGRYNEAITQYEKGLNAALQNNDSSEMAAHYGNMGIAYFLMGIYEESINHYLKALDIDKAQKKIESIGIDYSVIGNVLSVWGKQDQAKEFFENALAIARALNNQSQISTRLNKLASTLIALGNYDTALQYLQESLTIARKLDEESKIGSVLNQIGFAHFKSGNYVLAEEYFLDALDIPGIQSDIKMSAIIYANLAKNHMFKGDLSMAEQSSMESIKRANEINLAGTIVENYDVLSRIYKQRGEFEKSLAYYQKFALLKDSLFTSESQRRLAEFEVIYDTEKKENEIKLLNSQKLLQETQIKDAKQRFLFLSIISTLLLGLILLMYVLFLNRRKMNRILQGKNEQLQQLNATKDRFISIIAHDLKNPFTAFYNITSSLHKNKETISESEKDRFIASIHDASLKLKELLNSLLDWARLQRDHIGIDVEPLDLGEITQSSILYNAGILKSKDIRIKNEVPKQSRVLANKNALLSVLNNLITNAVKFSESGQEVIVFTQIEKNHIDLVVEDHGIGLSSQEIDSLFRIDVDTRKIGTSKEKGTGMGLILCKELLEKINGKIMVVSTLGQGSRFIVSLPVMSN